MKKAVAATVLLLTVMVVFSCKRPRDPGKDIALEVGGRKISVNQLRKDIASQSAKLLDPDSEIVTLEGPLLDSIVDYYLIQEYAKQHHITISKAELLRAIQDIKKDYPEDSFEETLLRRYVNMEQWKKALETELLRKKVFDLVTMDVRPPSSIEIEQYYREHLNDFKRSPRVRFRQIVTHSKEKAKEALDRIKKGESIADLARIFSYSPEAAKGGEVGWVEKGQLDPSMDKVLFSLPVGKVSPIVKSPYGYHIFQVIEVVPGGLQPLKRVAPTIQHRLYSQARERAFQQWLQEQRSRVKIKVLKKSLKRMPRENG